MGRPKGNQTEQVCVRLSPELLEAVDAAAARMAESVPGVEFTRADVIRSTLTAALLGAPAPAKRASTTKGRNR